MRIMRIMKIMKIMKILVSILIFIFLIFLLDFFVFVKTANESCKVSASWSKYTGSAEGESCSFPKYSFKLVSFKDHCHLDKEQFRPVMNKDSKEDSILIFGCSYAAGYVFDNEQTISYVLSKYSTRPVFNRASSGRGLQFMLWQLKSDKDFYKEVKKPKYVFYVLMGGIGHFERLYYTAFPNCLDPEFYFTYKEKNGELVERKPLFGLYYDLHLTRHIYNKFIFNKVINDFDNPNSKMYDFFTLHFKKSNEIIKKQFGDDVKFIILTFENTNKEYWRETLEKEGIDVVDISETIGIQNLEASELGFFEPEVAAHPNGKIWELLIPKLKEMYPDL